MPRTLNKQESIRLHTFSYMLIKGILICNLSELILPEIWKVCVSRISYSLWLQVWWPQGVGLLCSPAQWLGGSRGLPWGLGTHSTHHQGDHLAGGKLQDWTDGHIPRGLSLVKTLLSLMNLAAAINISGLLPLSRLHICDSKCAEKLTESYIGNFMKAFKKYLLLG